MELFIEFMFTMGPNLKYHTLLKTIEGCGKIVLGINAAVCVEEKYIFSFFTICKLTHFPKVILIIIFQFFPI